MASSHIRLDPHTVEAIARRVVGLLQGKERRAGELIDAAELARRLGVDRSWIYAHAIELGAVKLGRGPRPRLRFDPGFATKGFRASVGPRESTKPSQPRRRPSTPEGGGDRLPLLPIKGSGAS
jgi:hypothetical protein